MQKIFLMIGLSLMLALTLVGCASAPLTQEECRDLGGDVVIDFHAVGQVCCKIGKINGAPYCEEVKRERPTREPKVHRE